MSVKERKSELYLFNIGKPNMYWIKVQSASINLGKVRDVHSFSKIVLKKKSSSVYRKGSV